MNPLRGYALDEAAFCAVLMWLKAAFSTFVGMWHPYLLNAAAALMITSYCRYLLSFDGIAIWTKPYVAV